MVGIFIYSRRSSLAGFPAHTPFSVMDFVTTLPAPITTPSQMLTARIVAPLPIDTSSPSRSAPAGAVGVWFTLAKQVVGKHHAVTDKAALADGDVLADKGMGLNFTVRADAGIPLDLNERPDEDVIAEPAIIEVGGLVNNDIFPTNDVTYAGITKLRHSSSQIGLARICKVLCWLAEWKVVSLMCCIP